MAITTDGRPAVGADKSGPGRDGSAGRTSLVWVALVVASVLCVGAMLFMHDHLTVGILGILALLLLMALRIPVGVALAIAGVAGVWSIAGTTVTLDSLATRPFGVATSWSLSVLPMFILMSYLLASSGATTKIFNVARAWLGWAPGGLAVTTMFAGAGFSAISGSSVSIAYALGRVALPEMFRSGYQSRLALGTVMMSGTTGNLIPPAITMVVYAGIAEVPVGEALIAGLVPGIVLAVLYAALISGRTFLRPELAGGRRKDAVRAPGAPASVGKVRSLVEVTPILAVIVVVVGGIYQGFFTATEAGAVGVVASIVIAAAYLRKKFWKAALAAIVQSALATAAIFLLLAGAQMFNRMLVLSGAARWVSDRVVDISINSLIFILVAGLIFVIIGCFMESTSIILITVPLFLPALLALDIDLIWFGVFTVLLVEIGLVTPPLGLLAYATHAIAQDPAVNLGRKISLVDVFRSALFFLPAPLILVILLVVFPQLTSVMSVK